MSVRPRLFLPVRLLPVRDISIVGCRTKVQIRSESYSNAIAVGHAQALCTSFTTYRESNVELPLFSEADNKHSRKRTFDIRRLHPGALNPHRAGIVREGS